MIRIGFFHADHEVISSNIDKAQVLVSAPPRARLRPPPLTLLRTDSSTKEETGTDGTDSRRTMASTSSPSATSRPAENSFSTPCPPSPPPNSSTTTTLSPSVSSPAF